jgi:carbon monoxide dehydrogenase subunit G
MHFEGKQTINVPIQTVWAYVMDPHKVAACAPGFKSMEILGDDHFKPTLAVGVGPIKATFTLDVLLQDLQPPTHAGLTARGSAVGSGVEMRSAMDLVAEAEAVTSMNWVADVLVSGTIASVGARLMEGVAHKLTAQFFNCLRLHLEAPSEAPPGAPTPEPTT